MPLLLFCLRCQNAFAPKRLHSSHFNFLIDVFWKYPFQGSWKHCRIYKLSKITKKLFTCYKINGSNSGGNGGKSTSICIGGAFGAYYPSIIGYVTENNDALFPVDKSKGLCAKMPLRQNASTHLNSIFSSIYFVRTYFRGLGNIVGFTNSRNSPRNYSSVIKSMDQKANLHRFV